jgi:hypothetical protein
MQPNGDLPEGIVVPPPVIGNDTNDGAEENFDSGLFVPTPPPVVQNRARQESGSRPFSGNPSQNRGQDFLQPPSGGGAPTTRTPQLVVDQSFEELPQDQASIL